MNNRKVVAVVVAVLVVLAAAAGGLYVFTRDDSSNVITRTLGGGESGDPNTISIYAPSQLSKVLERLTTTFQQEQPGTTFQFTLGPSEELSNRIQSGQKPNLYIDVQRAIEPVAAETRQVAAPAAFGHDIVQLAVKRGNPKQVDGLGVFGPGSPVTTGICGQELFCGQLDAIVLQGAGVNPAPKVVTNNVGDLTDGVKSGRIDAVLLLRTDIRSVLTSITNIPLRPTSRVDYQMAQFRSGGITDQFVQWVQTAPSARQALRHTGLLSFYGP